jgi:non-homologous end joining protein Ku
VEAKVAGQEITAAPAEARRAQVIDLMEALKQSLANRPGGQATPERRPARAKRSASPSTARRTAKK